MGGGILPIAFHNNKTYILIGREYLYAKKNGGLWSDFGGGKHKNETFEETGVREGYEETMGHIGSKNKIKKLIKEKLVKIIDIKCEYKMYIIEIDYDKDLPKKFRDDFLKVKKEDPELINNNNGLYEKDMIRWIELGKIKNDYNK